MKPVQNIYQNNTPEYFKISSLTWREKRRLRIFEKKELWKIFGPKSDDVTGEWRRLHDEELYALYSSNIFG
jgi:hypothetical protein